LQTTTQSRAWVLAPRYIKLMGEKSAYIKFSMSPP
jgi:hypothetical protein